MLRPGKLVLADIAAAVIAGFFSYISLGVIVYILVSIFYSKSRFDGKLDIPVGGRTSQSVNCFARPCFFVMAVDGSDKVGNFSNPTEQTRRGKKKKFRAPPKILGGEGWQNKDHKRR
jgi:hypothetical protein